MLRLMCMVLVTCSCNCSQDLQPGPHVSCICLASDGVSMGAWHPFHEGLSVDDCCDVCAHEDPSMPRQQHP